MKYDIIIVGARLAGSATAMLLARAGLRVLVIDQARFPSDTLSTHQLQVPGGALLRRWGLLERLVDAGTPGTRHVRFESAGVELAGDYPSVDGVDALHSPRRTLLDDLLVQAARASGAEVRESTIVEDLTAYDGRVTGVRCRPKHGRPTTETALLVVGADGKHSLVAKQVGARAQTHHPPSTLAAYTYWEDVPLSCGHVVNRDRRAVGVWPTNDGLTITYLAWPADEVAAYRSDPRAAVRMALQGTGELGQRVLAGRRVEPIRATTDLPNAIRESCGPGWALAGDAGLVMDPITGQGMGNALRDADLLASAVTTALDGPTSLEATLKDYVRARDRRTRAMYDLTVGLASLPPSQPAERALFEAIAARPEEVTRFLGTLSGSLPVRGLFSPPHLIHLVGLRGFARLATARPRPRRPVAMHAHGDIASSMPPARQDSDRGSRGDPPSCRWLTTGDSRTGRAGVARDPRGG